MTIIKMFIAGAWIEGSLKQKQPIINPANEEVISYLTLADEVDLKKALNSAEIGLCEWKSIVPWERGTIMKNAADLLRERKGKISSIMTGEHGKTLQESEIEIIRAADFIEWGGEEARRLSSRLFSARDEGSRVMIEKSPIGVVAAFTPWNYPVLQPSKKLGALLAAGCSCILKPAEETPASTNALLQCFLDAGLPANVINLVYGEPSKVSSFLIRDHRVRKITFTGSVPVGKILAAEAGKHMKPVTMELGGHSPVIVFPDVNLEKVAEILVVRKFANSSQVCVAPNRFFIHEKIIDEFTKIFCEKASSIKIGDGAEPSTTMRPMANERRIEAMEKLIKDAVSSGAEVVIGGTRLSRPGYFFPPTVLRNVDPCCELMTVEPFGPVVPINGFKDENEAINVANNSSYGLAGYIFTGDQARQERLSAQLQVGTIGVNDIPAHTADIPLGGWKDSGVGVEGGIEMTHPYTKSQFRYIKSLA